MSLGLSELKELLQTRYILASSMHQGAMRKRGKMHRQNEIDYEKIQ